MCLSVCLQNTANSLAHLSKECLVSYCDHSPSVGVCLAVHLSVFTNGHKLSVSWDEMA